MNCLFTVIVKYSFSLGTYSFHNNNYLRLDENLLKKYNKIQSSLVVSLYALIYLEMKMGLMIKYYMYMSILICFQNPIVGKHYFILTADSLIR